MQNKTAFGAIAAASMTVGVLFSASPAAAQTVDGFSPDCATGVLAYTPGLTAGSASDTTPAAGDAIVLNSGAGSFDPGTAVAVTFNGVAVGSAPVDGAGNASTTFTVPAGTPPGVFIVVFRGTLGGATNVVGVCFAVEEVLAGGGGGPATPPEPAPPAEVPISGGGGAPVAAPDRPSALPFTGSVELLAVAGLGAALVAVGAGTVVVARRRRDGALPA